MLRPGTSLVASRESKKVRSYNQWDLGERTSEALGVLYDIRIDRWCMRHIRRREVTKETALAHKRAFEKIGLRALR